MKKLLSLPPNLVSSFHQITNNEPAEWFCASDPLGTRLGSGGGTTWILESCYRNEQTASTFEEWLSAEKRIILHAGGQSRRLPGYAPSGKILTPIPVFRWARGQRLSQDLLSLQLPLYEEIMRKVPDSLHTLIASGDVYLRHSEPLQTIPEADVVCYGLWVDPELATRHGVFVSSRDVPDRLDFMLQKPSFEELRQLAGSHFFLMDIGVWLLSDRAVRLLVKRSYQPDGKQLQAYDLYAEFGCALGTHPRIADEELNALTVAILPLPGGEFYHYGTSRELISSTLSVQNLVHDQRLIMQRAVKPHPAMFVQNAIVRCLLTSRNSELWIENSYIGEQWTLNWQHVITGVPQNNWPLYLPAGTCVDVVPVTNGGWVARPYGFADLFKGGSLQPETCYLGQPLGEWAMRRKLSLPDYLDIQEMSLFPVCRDLDELGVVLRWMVSEPELAAGKSLWEKAQKYSANRLSDQADLCRLFAQRACFRKENWSTLAANYRKSVFYQLDLDDAASAFVHEQIALPEPLPEEAPLMTRIQNHAFRARVWQATDIRRSNAEEWQAFSLLRDGLVRTIAGEKQIPRLDVYRDQIVWARSPVRIDLAGGWTDTPPYCLYAGGNVVNVAIELNGQPPLQVYVKPSYEHRHIILRSIDIGAMECVSTWDELHDFKKIGSPFSIPKAALALAGFVPEFSASRFASLEKQLDAFGCGLEVTLLAAVPTGSGLGTSSILAATVLGALSDFCGLAWDKNGIGNRTLILEQLLTTGGGWQDQYGGVLHGLKLLQTNESTRQTPTIRWLPEYLFTEPEYQACHLLYYTGITRTAKGILSEIVRQMFLNNGTHLRLLSEMKTHALELVETILHGDFQTFGQLVGKSWEQNKALDAGTNPPAIESLIARIRDYALGYKLPGAGGGGYLYIVAKDPESALQIRRVLGSDPLHASARFVDMNLSDKGLQISRS